jgi:anaerobic magnesium-protoporphyrin IX monomethyl ester cyclase
MSGKILLLNLPNKEQITRRYMCSYVSPESLLPPIELISVGAIAREWKKVEVKLLDAIAEKKSSIEVKKDIEKNQYNCVISIIGFESFEEDMDEVNKLKEAFPSTTFILFGHYPTNFPKETLQHSKAEYIILGEPDLIFSELYDALFSDKNLLEIDGICYFKDNEFVQQGKGNRIGNPNDLPIPCYDLLPVKKYHEPLLPMPYGMIQTARGCPYQCDFCVKSYGTKLTTLTPERIVQEIKIWKTHFNVKSIRFIDDTFTINKKRVLDLCKLMIKEELNIEWACLSRTDNIDAELLEWMKKSGCKRIYFGMESGSQRMLDLYKKSLNVEEAKKALHLCRKYDIETAAFFMSGHPDETEDDFIKTLEFAKSAKLSFASFNPLTPYPGTSTYEEFKNKIDFSIYPYKNEWHDKSIYDEFDRRKKIFYKTFYLRPSYFISNAKTLFFSIKEFSNMGIGMLRYLWFDKKFVISGLKGYKDR